MNRGDEQKRSNNMGGLKPDEQNNLPKGVHRTKDVPARLESKESASTVKLGLAGFAVGVVVASLFVTWWALPRRAITISIDSIPQGIDVFIDGQRAGVTPTTYRSPRRQKTLHLELRGEQTEPYKRDIYLPLFGSVDPILTAMPLRRAQLRLRTQPDAVKLFIDGEERCSSPCDANDIAPRQFHVLRFEREGCADYWDLVKPEPGERLLVKAKLQAQGVKNLVLLRILSSKKPVLLDGRDYTKAFSVGAVFVSAGRHLLKMGTGKNVETEILVLSAGRSQRFVFGGSDRVPNQPLLEPEGRILGHQEGDLDEKNSGHQVVDETSAASVDVNNVRKPMSSEFIDYAQFLLARGQASEAKKYFMNSFGRGKKSPRAYRGIIAAALAMGDLKLARGQLQDLIDTFADLPDRELLKHVFAGAAKAGLCYSENDSPK